MSVKTTARAEQKRQTRARLLAAARTCFTAPDPSAVTVAQIAREARVAHGTFYVHFPSREAVLDALVTELEQQLEGALAAAWAEESALGPLVRRSTEVFLDVWYRERDLVRAYVERAAITLIDLRDGVSPPMVTALSAALLARGLARDVAELAARSLLAMWMRIGLQYLFNPAVSRERAVEVLARMSLGAITALIEEVGDDDR